MRKPACEPERLEQLIQAAAAGHSVLLEQREGRLLFGMARDTRKAVAAVLALFAICLLIAGALAATEQGGKGVGLALWLVAALLAIGAVLGWRRRHPRTRLDLGRGLLEEVDADGRLIKRRKTRELTLSIEQNNIGHSPPSIAIVACGPGDRARADLYPILSGQSPERGLEAGRLLAELCVWGEVEYIRCTPD